MKHTVQRLFAGLLALCMLFSAVPAVSAEAWYSTQDTAAYANDEIVRVSIVLDAPPALEQYADAGSAAKDIAADDDAQAYQDTLLRQQREIVDAISRDVLGGEPLDVVWNLTLVSNTISANVPSGAIDAIGQIPGVSQVLVEPLCKGIEQSASSASASTSTSTSPSASAYAGQLGTVPAYEKGYQGAGMRIAILDTGIDPDHISFDGRALAYALQKDYGEDYATELHLLTADEIRSKWSQLNVSKYVKMDDDDIDSLYYSEKLPFNFNYPERKADASHDDTSGAHGSHVAGIAAANRYVYLSPEDTAPVVAAENVLAQGVAPDAQLLAMKIIGTSGGAYPSDQFAAIEDALVLGADAINLSIGTDWAGFPYTDEYQSVLDRLQQTDTVVAIAAGNYGSTVDNGTEKGLLHIEDVNLNTVCDPGSFTNAFTVASTNSNSRIGTYFTVNGRPERLFYWEANKGDQLISLAREEAYPYVYLDGIGVVGDPNTTNADGTPSVILEDQLPALNDAVPGGLTGKVVLMNRGISTFAEKADAAAALGAIAVIVVNNEAGSVSADLQNYQHEDVPVATMDLNGKEALMQNTASTGTIATHFDSQGNAADGTVSYYTGTLTIVKDFSLDVVEDAPISMSSFSAWGVPGSLELKPEITAPGGDIISVNGASKTNDGYSVMSGTSMATAQIAGLTALVTQYAKENHLKDKTGLTYRALAQSLLMSTAVPLQEEDSRYYPILQQGAGLANAGNAIAAPSYITVSDQPDGKVKVELKDDPDRTGSYRAVFTIHNLTDEALEYTVGADLFTQAIETLDGEDYLSSHTAALQAEVTVNGAAAPAKVSVPASGETTVSVFLTLTDAQKASLNSSYPNGAYIQAFLNVVPTAGDGVRHSIPVLGFYGNWTDPSMFDPGYCPDGLSDYGLTLEVNGYAGQQFMLNNPYEDDGPYLEERNAFDPDIGTLSSAIFLPLRNYAAGKCVIRDAETGTVYLETEIHENYGTYYIDTAQIWGGYNDVATLDWSGNDANGNPLPEGTKLSVEVTLAPEYYRSTDGTGINWDALGRGATLSTTVTIDRTAPEVVGVDNSTLEEGYLTVTVRDNQYVGMVSLYRASAADGEDPLSYVLAHQTEAGKATEVYLPIDPLDLETFSPDGFVLKVGDYAGHVASYPLSNLDGSRFAVAIPALDTLRQVPLAQVDDAMGNEILRQLREEDAEGVLIYVDAPFETSLPSVEVSIPRSLLQSLEQQDVDNVRVITPLANVILPNAAFSTLKASQGNASIRISQGSTNTTVELSVDGSPITVPSGILMQLPYAFSTPCTVAVQVKDGNSFKVLPTSVADSTMKRVTFPVIENITVCILETGTDFSDVPDDAWYEPGVSFASAHWLVSGVGGDRFAPTANITRASIATLLYNMEWDPETGYENPFQDVASGAWYETAVAWAAGNNIISGNGAGGFSPDLDITREQLAVFLYNYAKFCGLDVSAAESLSAFTDQGAVSSWARPAMNWAVSNGLLHGVGGNKLQPGGTATRAEVAVLMMNYVEFLAGVSLDS